MKSKVSSEELTGELNDTEEGGVRQDGNSGENSFCEEVQAWVRVPRPGLAFFARQGGDFDV